MTQPVSLRSLAYALRPKAAAPQANEHRTVRRIDELASVYRRQSDAALRGHAASLAAERKADAPSTSDWLARCFALLAEAMRRVIGVRPFEVQLLAGLALHRRSIAEMQTGEGKTLAAALPALAHALTGRGVHVMTVNAYLAARDCELLGPVYQFLGVSCGLLPDSATVAEKQAAYACDITYGPGYEFGFDYLRDQVARMARHRGQLGQAFRRRLQAGRPPAAATAQRGLSLAIVDEADSVMLDEATTPLILAGPAGGAPPDAQVYHAADRAARCLHADRDYLLDRKAGAVYLTDDGLRRLRAAQGEVPAEACCRPWPQYVEQALRANLLLLRDVDYVIDDHAVRIVDDNTGRVFENRSWRDGLRQAVEAKERLPLTTETRPLARISRQRYFRLYDRLCGLTGTATGSEREFWETYRLTTVAIPLRKPSRRTVLPTRMFAAARFKWKAIAEEVQRIHRTGQPILIGTRTIQDSELVARHLDQRQIPYRLLNGKQDADEARIVARAGQPGAVTVATNMAGRGTDIRLAPDVLPLGGLHVIGCERHRSARVDRQLIGRCARQGDPGSARFFVSADDALLAVHAPRLAQRMKRLADPNGEMHADLGAEIAALQQRLERRAATLRRQLLAHDRWIEEIADALRQADENNIPSSAAPRWRA